VGLGFEVRALCLQSRCSTAWATPPFHFALVLELGSCKLFAWAGLELWSSWCQPPMWLGLYAWSTVTQLAFLIFKLRAMNLFFIPTNIYLKNLKNVTYIFLFMVLLLLQEQTLLYPHLNMTVFSQFYFIWLLFSPWIIVLMFSFTHISVFFKLLVPFAFSFLTGFTIAICFSSWYWLYI
jgi:hypothetical protein